jgi:hypothetical protein
LLQRFPDRDEFTRVAHSTRLHPSMVDASLRASSGLMFLQPRTGGSRFFRRWRGRLGDELDPGSHRPTEAIGGERQLARESALVRPAAEEPHFQCTLRDRCPPAT